MAVIGYQKGILNSMFYYVKSLEPFPNDSIPKIKLQEVKECTNFL